MHRIAIAFAFLVACAAAGSAELADTLAPAPDHPAIGYFHYPEHPPNDPVSVLNRKIRQGLVQLHFEDRGGYLQSVLKALNIPIESQIAVFSKTSLQAPLIEPDNPRTIFFGDSVAVAWMRGGFIELAAQDPEQGIIYHTLEQQPSKAPEFVRRDHRCLPCHMSEASLGVPGMMVRSRFASPDGSLKLILGGYTTDHRSPFEERWGGWYVSGTIDHARHMGNTVFADEDKPEAIPVRIDQAAYLSPYSDIAALLVFNHQMHMMNLLTRIGWEARAGLHDKLHDLPALLRDAAKELVDYLLFVDEAQLPGRIESMSGFPEKFAAFGPRDSHGRSLRQLNLNTRLMQYPCSYMIYTDAFESLPAEAREAIYQRMWQILSGQERAAKYSRLALADRQAIVEILRETKKGLPDYFRPVTK